LLLDDCFLRGGAASLDNGEPNTEIMSDSSTLEENDTNARCTGDSISMQTTTSINQTKILGYKLWNVITDAFRMSMDAKDELFSASNTSSSSTNGNASNRSRTLLASSGGGVGLKLKSKTTAFITSTATATLERVGRRVLEELGRDEPPQGMDDEQSDERTMSDNSIMSQTKNNKEPAPSNTSSLRSHDFNSLNFNVVTSNSTARFMNKRGRESGVALDTNDVAPASSRLMVDDNNEMYDEEDYNMDHSTLAREEGNRSCRHRKAEVQDNTDFIAIKEEGRVVTMHSNVIGRPSLGVHAKDQTTKLRNEAKGSTTPSEPSNLATGGTESYRRLLTENTSKPTTVDVKDQEKKETTAFLMSRASQDYVSSGMVSSSYMYFMAWLHNRCTYFQLFLCWCTVAYNR